MAALLLTMLAAAAAAPPRPAARAPARAPAFGGAPRLSAEQLLRFGREGHACTRALLSPAELRALSAALQAALRERRAEALAKIEADHGAGAPAALVPFEQLFNVWASDGADGAARALALSERLGETAAALLGCKRVRLAQDTLLLKRAGHGETGWHSDLRMVPLDTNAYVTCWLALTPVPRAREGGSALLFARGSHVDMAHLFHAREPTARVEEGRYALDEHAPLAPGDATWHHGWTLHCAPPNGLRAHRLAYALSYVDARARTLPTSKRGRLHGEDAPSHARWLAELDARCPRGGCVAEHPLLPLLPRGGSGSAARRPAAGPPADGGGPTPSRSGARRRRGGGGKP